jgi:phosphoribosylanthranilate isomerase
MTWVKLCGMRTAADVEAALAAGADAVGFVTVPGSPRRITVEEAGAAGQRQPIATYLVTVDLEPAAALEAAGRARVDGLQPHGRHARAAAEAALAAGLQVLFPVPARRPLDVGGVPDGAVPLLDTADPDRHGGTGRSFDWTVAAGLDRPVVLAGGLTADTVADAIRIAAPWGVDVSSGIESAPGVKDHGEMRRFVEAVR